ncbi:DUF305 domain-containing protein [Actinomadura alba]|uniref:DUF305 domain-containing protein n=1 Tax=Actinomadura alba TaxID=406431 RepID=UPI0031DA20DF
MTEPPAPPAQPTGPARPGRWAATVAAALVIGLAGVLIGVMTARPGRPLPDGPEAGFARDMSTHHAQAVEMSFLVRDRTRDQAVRTLAYDVINTQSVQIGMMTAWLDAWGAPKIDPAGRMRWMAGHGGHQGGPAAPMPGMAAPEQMRALEKADGRTAEIDYLRLMVVHHRGGVEMAQAVLVRSDRAEVARLARTIVTSQRSEIELMNRMLAERGAPAV